MGFNNSIESNYTEKKSLLIKDIFIYEEKRTQYEQRWSAVNKRNNKINYPQTINILSMFSGYNYMPCLKVEDI